MLLRENSNLPGNMKDTLSATRRLIAGEEKSLPAPPLYPSVLEIINQARNLVINSGYSICFCEDLLNENLMLRMMTCKPPATIPIHAIGNSSWGVVARISIYTQFSQVCNHPSDYKAIRISGQ